MIRRINFIKEGKEVFKLPVSKNLFTIARKVLANEDKIIMVTDKESKPLFFLEKVEDYVYLQNGTKYCDFNVEGININKDNLDDTLLKEIDIFIFYELDEYTYLLTELIRKKYPDKRLVFMDPFANLLLDNEVEIYTSIKEVYVNNYKKIMHIHSCRKEKVQLTYKGEEVIYSSLLVLQSLCWAKNIASFGNANSDKIFILIEFDCQNAGMGDIIISVQQYIRLAKQRGWIPYIYVSKGNQYISCDGDNMWNYYFEQPSDINLKELFVSKRVIRGRDNHFGVLPWVGNPLCNMQDALKENVVFNKNTINYFEKNLPEIFKKDKKILGIIARGTDLAKGTNIEINLDKLIEESKKEMKKGYDYMFLATEDQIFFEEYQKVFKEKIIAISQKRINYDYKNNEYKYISELLGIDKKNKFEWGRQYLFITYCLSKCNALLYSIPCGALRLANIWKKDSYAYVKATLKAISSISSKDIHNVITIDRCEKFLIENKQIVIYGLGDVAYMIYPILSKFKEKIVACDKRALYEEYKFFDIKVITPPELLTLDKEIRILVTSPRCGEEIKEELITMGIKKDNIFQLLY